MKKVLRNIVCGLAAVNLIALAASCSDGLDDDDPFVKNGVVTTSGGNNASGNGDTPADNGGTATSGSFDMPENQYDKGNTQYKGPTGIASLAVGDKVKMTFKGKASKAFKGEFFIVDTTPTAGPNGYWGELAEKYVLDVPAEFNITHTFEITQKPWGTGDESTYFAVVGKDDATTIHIDYTELKFEKLGGSSSSGDAGNQQNNGTGENQQTTGGETTEPTTGENTPAATDDHGLLDASVDLTWDGGATVAASKLASATDTSKFVVTYTANTDTDYHTFKMRVVSPEQELYEGTATGITINTTATSANDLHGCSFVTAPAATANTFSYQPSAAEWTALKAGGFNIYGHGAKITKIVLEAGISGEVNAEASGEVNAEETGGAAANQDETTVQAVTFNTARKAYTLTTSKAVKKDDVGLTFQYFVAEGADPVSVDVTNLKVSLKIGDADAIEKTIDKVEIRHHTWDNNAQESNARVNLGIGSADEEIASGTTVVLQVLEATVSDSSKVDGITFALQQDGNHSAWDMLTAATSKPFAE